MSPCPPHPPRLNEPAPAFQAVTTHGVRRLEDYRGKWLVLFSHPADFTPVCTTEFIAFAQAQRDFQAVGCELLGLSIDSHYAHAAWGRNIKEKFGVEIGFPIIADLSMDVARAYGMIRPGASDTSAVQATFVIGPPGGVARTKKRQLTAKDAKACEVMFSNLAFLCVLGGWLLLATLEVELQVVRLAPAGPGKWYSGS